MAAALVAVAPLSAKAQTTGVGSWSSSSLLPPTGADISQPLHNATNYDGTNDFPDHFGGIGEAFVPATTVTMKSFTVLGTGNAGNDDTGWDVLVGTLAGLSTGAAATTLDSETAAPGAVIASDVTAGKKSQYETFTLANPVTLTAGTLYYFDIHNTSNGWYGITSDQSGGASTGGEAFSLSTDGTSIENAQPGVDRTFYINGTPGTTPVQVTSRWKFNGSGNWEDGTKWDPAEPQFDGDNATFDNYNGTITANPTVTLSSAVTVASLTFNTSAVSYTIANGGGAQINVGNTSSGAVINVLGNHVINGTVNIVANYSISVAGTITVNPNSSLSIATLTGGSYGNVNFTGGGSLTVDKLDTMNTSILGGTVVTTRAGGATTHAGYDSLDSGAVLNINTTFEMWQVYDDGTDKINIGSAGSLVAQTQYNSAEFITGTVSGSGSINIGGSADSSNGNGSLQLSGTNSNFSGPILVTNGFQLRLGNQSTTTLQAANSWGNDSATNTLTLDNGKLWVVPTITAGVATSYVGNHIVIINGGGGTIETNDANDSTATNFSGTGFAGAFTLGIGSISGPGTLTVDGGGNLAVAAQVVAANSSGGIRSLSLGGLTLLNNSNISFGSSTLAKNRTVFVTGNLSLSGATGAWTSAVDLANNDLIVQNGSLSAVRDQLHQGYAGGSWQGSGGIVSTSAASDTRHLTTLAVIQNSVDQTSSGATLFPTFDGVASSSSDVLVKYTYYGDANLDGRVDGSDYTLIDNGYNQRLTGWFNGDFNGDGHIDGSDYTLIDNAYLSQGAALSALVASPAAVATAEVASSGAAVPEPASLSLLGIGALGLLRRRNRPHR